MSKTVLIIGAGMGGLAVGCYLQMNGYDTQIFEMHDKAGGLCTAWERKGYKIDGCIQWLWGSAPHSDFYKYWEEVGVVQGKQIINLDELIRVETLDGKIFRLYTNADRLEKEMKEIAPEDAKLIEEFCDAIRHFSSVNMPVDKNPELFSPLDYLKMTKMLGVIRGFSKWEITISEFAERFKNPLLSKFWHQIWEPDMSALNLVMQLAPAHNKSAGYPIGGSIPIAESIERRYLTLGGKLNFRKKVQKVLVQNNSAVGLQFVDGSEETADYVISAADGHQTIFELLQGKFVDDTIRGYYDNFKVFTPMMYIGLGINRSFDDFPRIISGLKFELEKPVVVGDVENRFLGVRIHNYDSTLARNGKTLLTSQLSSSWNYWELLKQNISSYNKEKERIANEVIVALDKRFPGLANDVEMHDVATPYTFYRYTGNWQGTYEGWIPSPKTPPTFLMKKTLPELENFYMVGQWVMPGGGLPTGVISGRWVTQMICKKDGSKFQASKP